MSCSCDAYEGVRKPLRGRTSKIDAFKSNFLHRICAYDLLVIHSPVKQSAGTSGAQRSGIRSRDSYFECERADGVMLTFPHAADQDLHLAVDPALFRPVQDAFLQQQRQQVNGTGL